MDQPLFISTPQAFKFLSADTISEPIEQKAYKEAISNQDLKQQVWKRAIQEDIDSLLDYQTWILTSFPPGCKALNKKWVYKIQLGPDGKIQCYKARWMVRGFQQREEIDYAKIFLSVVKPMSYEAIFALLFANNWEMDEIDMKTSFMYTLIENEVYINQRHGINDGAV